MSDEPIDRQIAKFLTTLAPPGSGPEAREAIMHGLASVLGMYLAGDLAKVGRREYKKRAQRLIDVMAGVAETSAVQLRQLRAGAGPATELVGIPRPSPAQLTSPPDDMWDPDGEKTILLSSLGAVIDVGELSWWRLPGFPAARVGVTQDGLLIVVAASPEDEQPEARWVVRRLADNDPESGSEEVR